MTTLIELLQPPSTDPTKPRNEWLTEHLVNSGHITANGISRRARIRSCRTCRHPVLAGLDADICALPAIVDPHPLTGLGEMLACLEHRLTYELRSSGNRGYRLNERDADKIAYSPAGTRTDLDVLRAHSCHARPLSAPETTDTVFARSQRLNLDPNAECPF